MSLATLSVPSLPDTPTGDLETDCAIFVSLVEAESDALWAQATWAARLKPLYRDATARQLSATSGKSPGYIRQLIRTALAFPPEERAQDLSFSHHRLCAATEDPVGWLTQAVANGWSCRELETRIAEAAESDTVTLFTQAEKAASTLESDARYFNDHWAATLGRRVVLSWADLPRADG